MDFFSALMHPDIPFLRYALLAGLLGSVAFGVVGSYVVVRRITYIAAAIAHSILAGIGLSLYLREVVGVTWFSPMMGSVLAALLSAVVIGLVSLGAQEREDTAIGAIWAIGMAAGLLLFALTPGYTDAMSYLFGNILLLSAGDLVFVAVLDLLIIGVVFFFYNKLLAVAFDEEFARIRGVQVKVFYILLLFLVALTVVLMVSMVGIVLVIALLTLPAAIAGQFCRTLWQMMAAGVAICAAVTVLGLTVSYSVDLPAGPVIIIVVGVVYLSATGLRRLVRT